MFEKIFKKNYLKLKFSRKNCEKKFVKKLLEKNFRKLYFLNFFCKSKKNLPKRIFRKKFYEIFFTNIGWTKFKWVEIGREWNFLTTVGWNGLKYDGSSKFSFTHKINRAVVINFLCMDGTYRWKKVRTKRWYIQKKMVRMKYK